MKRKNQQTQEQIQDLCHVCKKRPVEIYQLDYEVCCHCHQMETEVRFMDQDIPDV